MRTKVDGWKRKQSQVELGASSCIDRMKVKVKQLHRPHVALAVGMVLIMGLTMVQMHLQDDAAPPNGNQRTFSARLPGTAIGGELFQCDRSQFRTDICNMRGDIRMETHNKTKSFVLYAHKEEDHYLRSKETLKPYTRKWEKAGSMISVNEVTLQRRTLQTAIPRPRCDVHHKAPGVIFSTAGYTGNLYHEFNDGLIPLFISSQHLHREVVVIISSFHKWWYTKYKDVVGEITKHEVIDLEKDKRVHCFPEIEAGLHIHGELSVDPNRMPHHEGIQEFRDLLGRAYKPGPGDEEKIRARFQEEKKPHLTIIIRKTTRKFLNLDKIVQLGERLGFRVHLLIPNQSMELKKIYWLLNNTDVLLGVHGAAMTHLLFMRPGSVFIQVVPLGTDWAANEYYGEPAVKLGLKYVPYKIEPEESSLRDTHNATDPVLVDPESITQGSWLNLKKIYLEGQDVRPSLHRLGEVLKTSKKQLQDQRREEEKGRSAQ